MQHEMRHLTRLGLQSRFGDIDTMVGLKSQKCVSVQRSTKKVKKPFRAAVPFGGQITFLELESDVCGMCSAHLRGPLKPFRTAIPFGAN